MGERLKKTAVLRDRRKMRELYARGTRLTGNTLVCRYHLRPLKHAKHPRLIAAFVVNSKTLNAVQRNRMKRLMRETYRRLRNGVENRLIKEGFFIEMIFTARGVALPTYAMVHEEMRLLLQQVCEDVTRRT